MTNPAPVTVRDVVRWGDLDALGHVNNTVFFQFCESARLAYVEALGLARFFELPTDGPGMVACALNFRRQLRFPASVCTTARVTKLGQRSFVIEYQIFDEADGALIAEGTSNCLLVDYAAGKARTLSPALRQAIADFEGNPELAGEV